MNTMAPTPEGTRVPAIDVKGVTVRFTSERGAVLALDGIDMTVEEGGFLVLLGPSGCGKSTLLRVMADLVAPTKGSATIVGGTPEAARQRRDIGFVFQDSALLPWRTVLENVTLPMEVGGGVRRAGRDPHELLELVGLKGWENSYPDELSGGMRQRVSIARALVGEPRLLFMDEPFGALDEITRDRLNEELLKLWEATKMTVVFVTHSIYEATFLGQKVALLTAHPGRVREIVDVNLPYPRNVESKETPEFVAQAANLRRILETC
ncbi:MAG: ABC transporter ATP-binding protein [Pararhodobacter sp.]|nr:ABC transporter ATP-binding protein [Pararhodobacter sp.]